MFLAVATAVLSVPEANGLAIWVLRRPKREECGEEPEELPGLGDLRRGIPGLPPSEKSAVGMRICLAEC